MPLAELSSTSRAAGEPSWHLAAQVGARGPCVPLPATRCLPALADLLDEPVASAKRGSRACAANWNARCARPESKPKLRAAEAYLFDLAEDQKKGLEFSALYDIRALRVLVAGVPDVTRRSASSTPCGHSCRGVRRLHREPQRQSLPVAAHRCDRRRRTCARGADPLARHACARRTRFRRTLAVQGRQRRRREFLTQDRLDAPTSRQPRPVDDDAHCSPVFRTDVIEDRVYLLTPKGQVIDLPRGATVLDFALCDTHRCRLVSRRQGQRAHRALIPARSGDRVEILTARRSNRAATGCPRTTASSIRREAATRFATGSARRP